MQEMIKEYKRKIEDVLDEFFKEKIEYASRFGTEIKEAVEHLREYTLRGGKRLRAILMIKGYGLLKEENEEIVKASSSLELIQSYLLIHDDIMDESELRRNGPTYHKIYEKKFKNKLGNYSARFGENMAIIAGDLADAYAKEILLKSNFPEDLKNKAVKKLTEIIEHTGYGQILDIFSSVREDFGVEDLLKVHKLKTAIYTIDGPLQIGAILAGGDEDYLRKISDYAIPVGIAFQIQDDILGLFGEEDVIGKPVSSDLEEGKKTLHILYAMENEEHREYIMSVLGKKNISREELNKVREIVRESGALARAEEFATKLVNDALSALEKIDGRDEAKEFLRYIANYVVKRRY